MSERELRSLGYTKSGLGGSIDVAVSRTLRNRTRDTPKNIERLKRGTTEGRREINVKCLKEDTMVKEERTMRYPYKTNRAWGKGSWDKKYWEKERTCQTTTPALQLAEICREN